MNIWLISVAFLASTSFAVDDVVHPDPGAEILKSCLDQYDNQGVCKPSCLCDNSEAVQSNCPSRRVCCVTFEGYSKGPGEACLADPDTPGICASSCDESSVQGDCAGGFECCVTEKPRKMLDACLISPGHPGICKRVCNTEGDHIQGNCEEEMFCCEIIKDVDVGVACVVDEKVGVCLGNCVANMIDGGESTCEEELKCCLNDESVDEGGVCKLDKYKSGICKSTCEGRHSYGPQSDCKEGLSCCDDETPGPVHKDIGKNCMSEKGKGVCLHECPGGTKSGGESSCVHRLSCCIPDTEPNKGDACIDSDKVGICHESCENDDADIASEGNCNQHKDLKCCIKDWHSKHEDYGKSCKYEHDAGICLDYCPYGTTNRGTTETCDLSCCTLNEKEIGKECQSYKGKGICLEDCGDDLVYGGKTRTCGEKAKCCIVDNAPGMHEACKIDEDKAGICKYGCGDDYPLDVVNGDCKDSLKCCQSVKYKQEYLPRGKDCTSEGKDGVCLSDCKEGMVEGDNDLDCSYSYKCCIVQIAPVEGDACLLDEEISGICKTSCQSTRHNEVNHGNCLNGLACCPTVVEKDPKVGKECSSSSGSGICLKECIDGTIDGGDNYDCLDHAKCCVVDNEAALENVGKSCFTKHGSGLCLPQCGHGTVDSGRSSSCTYRLTCCVIDHSLEIGDACLIGEGRSGICEEECYTGRHRLGNPSKGKCSGEAVCCEKTVTVTEEPTVTNDPIDNEVIGKACESEGGDGICSPKCGYGSFDGGHSTYCKDLHCCVIDYRPAVGKRCNSNGGYATCAGINYCEDEGESNGECFEGVHCCTELPHKDYACDRGYGRTGKCVGVDSICANRMIPSCSYGYACC